MAERYQTYTANEVLYDEELGVIVEHTEWFPDLLDTVKHLHNTGQHGHPDLRLLAMVPGVVIEEWCQQQKVSFDDFTREREVRARFLNNPDNSAFRIWKGHV